MIGPTANILLLTDAATAEGLLRLRWPGNVVHRPEPYAALEELAARRYEAVVVSHPQPDFNDLLRAVRRLQPEAGIYAVCSPEGEAAIQLDRPGELTDYFIYPPGEDERRQVVRPPAPAGAKGAEANLPAGAIAELVESAGTTDGLAGAVLRLVQERTGLKLRWSDASEVGAAEQPLLLMDGDPPRILLGPEEAALTAAQRDLLETLKALLPALTGQARRTQALHRLAITDHLTGAYNRRYLYHFTDQLLRRAEPENFRVTLLLYDIDDFKRYNDLYGHATGDEILCEIVRLMKGVTRAQDLVARIGGDEFVVVFWDSEPPRRPDSRHPCSADILAERLLRAMTRHQFLLLGPEAKGALTISGGLASFPEDGRSCRDLLRRADAGLRQAKQSGKNAVYLAGGGQLKG